MCIDLDAKLFYKILPRHLKLYPGYTRQSTMLRNFAV